jgi:hypothetical protein
MNRIWAIVVFSQVLPVGGCTKRSMSDYICECTGHRNVLISGQIEPPNVYQKSVITYTYHSLDQEQALASCNAEHHQDQQSSTNGNQTVETYTDCVIR